jgi:hypothetical protein
MLLLILTVRAVVYLKVLYVYTCNTENILNVFSCDLLHVIFSLDPVSFLFLLTSPHTHYPWHSQHSPSPLSSRIMSLVSLPSLMRSALPVNALSSLCPSYITSNYSVFSSAPAFSFPFLVTLLGILQTTHQMSFRQCVLLGEHEQYTHGHTESLTWTFLFTSSLLPSRDFATVLSVFCSHNLPKEPCLASLHLAMCIYSLSVGVLGLPVVFVLKKLPCYLKWLCLLLFKPIVQ